LAVKVQAALPRTGWLERGGSPWRERRRAPAKPFDLSPRPLVVGRRLSLRLWSTPTLILACALASGVSVGAWLALGSVEAPIAPQEQPVGTQARHSPALAERATPSDAGVAAVEPDGLRAPEPVSVGPSLAGPPIPVEPKLGGTVRMPAVGAEMPIIDVPTMPAPVALEAPRLNAIAAANAVPEVLPPPAAQDVVEAPPPEPVRQEEPRSAAPEQPVLNERMPFVDAPSPEPVRQKEPSAPASGQPVLDDPRPLADADVVKPLARHSPAGRQRFNPPPLVGSRTARTTRPYRPDVQRRWAQRARPRESVRVAEPEVTGSTVRRRTRSEKPTELVSPRPFVLPEALRPSTR